jgi:hypothetical protein
MSVVRPNEWDDNVASLGKRLTGSKENLHKLESRCRCLQFQIEGPHRLEHEANHCPPMHELLLVRRSFHFDCQMMANAVSAGGDCNINLLEIDERQRVAAMVSIPLGRI